MILYFEPCIVISEGFRLSSHLFSAICLVEFTRRLLLQFEWRCIEWKTFTSDGMITWVCTFGRNYDDSVHFLRFTVHHIIGRFHVGNLNLGPLAASPKTDQYLYPDMKKYSNRGGQRGRPTKSFFI